VGTAAVEGAAAETELVGQWRRFEAEWNGRCLCGRENDDLNLQSSAQEIRMSAEIEIYSDRLRYGPPPWLGSGDGSRLSGTVGVCAVECGGGP
jgi:hypothetical protein